MLGAIRRTIFGASDASEGTSVPSTRNAPPSLATIYSGLVESSYSGPEIRMLTLRQPYAGIKHDLIRCRISCVPLHNPGTFTALSYTWGGPSNAKRLLINKIPVEVSDNLHDALEQLVSMNIERVWIDALCINQADDDEKSRQLQYMKLIYSQAKEVIAWIGKPSDDSSQAMKLLKGPEVHTHPSFRREVPITSTVTEEDRRNHWRMLDNLFDRPYWRRVWIVQEVAVAAKVRILCGTDEISWEELATARTVYERWKPAGLASKYRGGNYSYIEDITVFQQRYHIKEPIGLLFAMSKTQKALSTKPEDKIFALLGLCFDGSTLVPFPKYNRPMGEIMRDMTGQMILTYGCLDVMFPGSSQLNSQSHHRPSWARNWLDRDVLNAVDKEGIMFTPGIDGSWDFLLNESPPHRNVLKIQGLVYETISYCSKESNNDQFARMKDGRPAKYYSGCSEFQDAVYECLLKTEGQHNASFDVPEIEARRTFIDLARPQDKARDFDLRHFIHDFHIRSHHDCGRSFEALGTERDSKTSHFEQFLCYHPDYDADFEFTLLRTAKKFLGEVLDLTESARRDSWWSVPNYLQRVKANLTRKLKSSSYQQTHYAKHRVFAENFLSAALEKRKLIVLGNGQVGRVNGHAKIGDKICRIRGCNRPVVLRERTPFGGYRLVSDAILGFSDKDFSNQRIFAAQSGENWWERDELREKVKIFEVS